MPPRDNVYKEVGEVADAGLFIGFGAPVRGRERGGGASSTRRRGYYSRLQEEGVIESFEPAFLELHGGDLGGFILIRGEVEARIAPCQRRVHVTTIRVIPIVDKFGVVGADLAGRLERNMEFYIEQIGALAWRPGRGRRAWSVALVVPARRTEVCCGDASGARRASDRR